MARPHLEAMLPVDVGMEPNISSLQDDSEDAVISVLAVVSRIDAVLSCPNSQDGCAGGVPNSWCQSTCPSTLCRPDHIPPSSLILYRP